MSLLALRVRVSRSGPSWPTASSPRMAIYALFVSNFVGSFQNFLALMVLWIAPWAGVYFAGIWSAATVMTRPACTTSAGPVLVQGRLELPGSSPSRSASSRLPVHQCDAAARTAGGRDPRRRHLGLRRPGRLVLPLPGPQRTIQRRPRRCPCDADRRVAPFPTPAVGPAAVPPGRAVHVPRHRTGTVVIAACMSGPRVSRLGLPDARRAGNPQGRRGQGRRNDDGHAGQQKLA